MPLHVYTFVPMCACDIIDYKTHKRNSFGLHNLMGGHGIHDLRVMQLLP